MQRAAPIRSTLPILSAVFIEASQGTIRMVCTDLDTSVETHVAAEVSGEGCTVIPVKHLSDIVRHMSGSTVTFESEGQEEGMIRISSGRAVFELGMLNPQEFPGFPEMEGNATLTVSGRTLGNLIDQTVFAASLDDARPFLTGGLIEVHSRMISLVATDTFRLAISKTEIDFEGDPFSLIVPAKALLEFGRIIGSDDPSVSVIMSGKQICFDIGNTRLVSRVISGQFPDYRQVIPATTVARVKVNRQDLIEAIERTSVLSKDDFAGVKLSVESTCIVIKSDMRDVGRAHDEVECELFEGESCEVTIRSRYISEGLKAIGGEKVIIGISDPNRPVSFRREDGDACLYLVMPVALT